MADTMDSTGTDKEHHMGEQMTPDEAIRALDAIVAGDPELSHSEADEVLLSVVDPAVAEAYRRLVDRERWWATA